MSILFSLLNDKTSWPESYTKSWSEFTNVNINTSGSNQGTLTYYKGWVGFSFQVELKTTATTTWGTLTLLTGLPKSINNMGSWATQSFDNNYNFIPNFYVSTSGKLQTYNRQDNLAGKMLNISGLYYAAES